MDSTQRQGDLAFCDARDLSSERSEKAKFEVRGPEGAERDGIRENEHQQQRERGTLTRSRPCEENCDEIVILLRLLDEQDAPNTNFPGSYLDNYSAGKVVDGMTLIDTIARRTR